MTNRYSAGNPLNYYNGRPYSMTWRNGRQLDTVSVDGKTYQYEYDVNGLRTRKTNADGGYTEYYSVNGLTVAKQRFYPNGCTWYVMKYLLDEQNIPKVLYYIFEACALCGIALVFLITSWTYFLIQKGILRLEKTGLCTHRGDNVLPWSAESRGCLPMIDGFFRGTNTFFSAGKNERYLVNNE